MLLPFAIMCDQEIFLLQQSVPHEFVLVLSIFLQFISFRLNEKQVFKEICEMTACAEHLLDVVHKSHQVYFLLQLQIRCHCHRCKIEGSSHFIQVSELHVLTILLAISEFVGRFELDCNKICVGHYSVHFSPSVEVFSYFCVYLSGFL